MRSKFKWIFTLLVAFTMQFSFAQEKTVTGVVSDELGPIAGANVVVQGTTRGTTTDFDGNYTIKAKQGEVLVISYTGKKTAKITVAAASAYNVSLKDDVVEGVDVVVVGYGTTTREGVTGTASKINMENIQAKTVTNVTQALRGEVAGVVVTTTSGRPGENATLRIRGLGSVNGNRSPLYVVDGAPFSSDISAINPEDIADMTILKDAAATSIYGSRGANGVVLITTKQGKSGKSNITVDFKTSVNNMWLPKYDVISSAEEYIELSWSQLKMDAILSGHPNPVAYASANLYEDSGAIGINSVYNIWNVPGNSLIDPATGKIANGVARRYNPTSFADAALGTGFRSEANLQFSGGTDKTKYMTSFGYLDDSGVAVNSGYKRYSTRVNLEHKPKDWLTVGANISYSGGRYTRGDGSPSAGDGNGWGSSGNAFAYISSAPAIYDVYLRDAAGNLVADPYFGGYQYDYGQATGRRYFTLTNGVGDAHYDIAKDDATTVLGNFNLNVDITKALTFETRYSGQYQVYESTDVNNPYYGPGASSNGYVSKFNDKYTNQNFLQLLRYRKTFGDNHNLEAFVAHESTEYRRNVLTGTATGAVTPLSEEISQYTSFAGMNSYQQGYTLESYFSQLTYNYAQKYFFTGSVRRDGSSRFINNKWGTFGSVGLGWVVSKEDFMSNVDYVDYLKLKGSYGVIGDQGTALQYGWQLYNVTPLSGNILYTPSPTLGNPDLTWETSNIAQIGVESTWFNRLDLNVDYYVKRTTDLFFNQALPPSSGYTNIQVNDGELENSGLELDLNYRAIKAKNAGDFSLSFGINGEMMQNKVIEMPTDRFTGVKKLIQPHSTYFAYSEGRSIYEFYTREWAGVDPGTGVALWNLYYNDIDNNGQFNAGDEAISTLEQYMFDNPNANVQKTVTDAAGQATQKYIGKTAIPDVRGAARVNASYKNFDFTTQVGYSIGGYGYDYAYAALMDTGNSIGNGNFHKDIHNRWQQPGDVTNVPRLASTFGNDASFGRNTSSSRFITSTDYLSLNNIRVGYTLPSKYAETLGFSNANFYVSGDNLLVWTKRAGFNAQTLDDTNSFVAGNNYIPMSTLTFGVKVQF